MVFRKNIRINPREKGRTPPCNQFGLEPRTVDDRRMPNVCWYQHAQNIT